MSPSLALNLSNKTPGSHQLHSFLQMLQQPIQLLLSKTYRNNKASTSLCYRDPSSPIGAFKLYLESLSLHFKKHRYYHRCSFPRVAVVINGEDKSLNGKNEYCESIVVLSS